MSDESSWSRNDSDSEWSKGTIRDKDVRMKAASSHLCEDDVSGNTKAKRNEKRRLRIFLSFAAGKTILTLDDLPSDVAPMTADRTRTYAVQIHKVRNWTLPLGLKQHISQLPENCLRYSVSLSLYHAKSKRFFGSTWLGIETPAKVGIVNEELVTNELVYFRSKIANDNDCFGIIELVATEYLPHNIKCGQYGCGFALVQLFCGDNNQNNISPLDGHNINREKNGFCSLRVYKGTPRKLHFLKREDYGRLDDILMPGCEILCKVSQHEQLDNALNQLVAENQIIGAGDPVAGLAMHRWKCRPMQQTKLEACIGGEILRFGSVNALAPRMHPELAPTFTLILKNISVEFPYRSDYEEKLVNSLNASIPVEEAYKDKKTIFGRRVRVKQNIYASTNKTARPSILSRKLKIGIHNGHSFQNSAWRDIELDVSAEREDELVVPQKQIELSLGYVKHPLCALVLVIEYVVKPAKFIVRSHIDGAASNTDLITAVLGYSIFIPFDGKRLQLRNNPNNAPGCSLVLSNDKQCRLFAAGHMCAPSNDDSCQRICFELTCLDRNGTNQEEQPLFCKNEDDNGAASDSDDNMDAFCDFDETNATEGVWEYEDEGSNSSDGTDSGEEGDPFMSDENTISSSIVSGDTYSNFLAIRAKRLQLRANEHDHTKTSKHDNCILAKNTQDDPGTISDRQDADLSQHDVTIGDLPKKEKISISLCTGEYEALAQCGAHIPSHVAGSVISRASRTCLERNGYFSDGRSTEDVEEKKCVAHAVNEHNELQDHRQSLPKSIYFVFKLFDCKETVTEQLLLKESDGDNSDPTKPRMLSCNRSQTGEPEHNQKLTYSFELSKMQPGEASLFTNYLKTKVMFVDVWNGESLMQIGTMAVPLRYFMRQGEVASKQTEQFDVIAPRDLDQDGATIDIHIGKLLRGPCVGRVQMLLENRGKPGKGRCKLFEGTVTFPPSHQKGTYRVKARQLNCFAAASRRIETVAAVKSMLRQTCSKKKSQVAEGTHLVDLDSSLEALDATCIMCRENQKEALVRDHIRRCRTTTVLLSPSFGSPCFFEHEIQNPSNTQQRIEIKFCDSELRLVTDSKEWVFLRENGTVSQIPIEDDMIDTFSEDRHQVIIDANETISIPFAFLTVDASASERDIVVAFFSADTGEVASLLKIRVNAAKLLIDRKFCLFQTEGEILRRSIRLFGDCSNGATTDWHKCVRCVDLASSRNVVVDWQGSSDCFHLKHRGCGKHPSFGKFYVLIYTDSYQARLLECWKFDIQSRLKLEIATCLGQFTEKEVMIEGDTLSRRARFYSNDDKTITFEQKELFLLVPGAYNQAVMRFTVKSLAKEKIHLQLVDIDKRELISSWMIFITANLPLVSKEYTIDIPPGQSSISKKIPFSNKWDEAARYSLLSSDDNIMAIKNGPNIEILPGATEYIRLQIDLPPAGREKTYEAYLFVSDESNRSEECFLVRINGKE